MEIENQKFKPLDCIAKRYLLILEYVVVPNQPKFPLCICPNDASMNSSNRIRKPQNEHLVIIREFKVNF